MKPHSSTPHPDHRIMAGFPCNPSHRATVPVAVLALLLGAFLQQETSAQSASNFDTAKIAPKDAGKQTPSSKPAAAPTDAATVKIEPSRYVGKKDLDSYLQTVSAIFSIRSRTTDPFGQLQDPNAKPIVKPTVARQTRRMAPTQATPFADIIGRIRVTTVKPGDRLFFVGNRKFRQGDRFPIDFRGRAVNVEIEAVNGSRIDFRNLDSGEVASIKLDLLPPGLTQGSSGIVPKGLEREKANAPLEIESSSNLNETSQN